MSLPAGPLYAELAEGVMSYRVRLYHEHNLEKVYYYTEDCTGDLTVTTVCTCFLHDSNTIVHASD